jgi:glucosamine--fructose-6-phosphate aminotransferase (isomerizing)
MRLRPSGSRAPYPLAAGLQSLSAIGAPTSFALSMPAPSVTNEAMCGIFGFIATPGARLGPDRMRAYLRDLFELSEPRGQEASGLALAMQGGIDVFKRGLAPRRMMRTRGYQEFLAENLAKLDLDANGVLQTPVAALGHCRLVTNGAEIVAGNNHPVLVGRTAGIHNGIVTNDAALWARHPEFTREHDIDSEVLFRLLDFHTDQGGDLAGGLRRLYREIEGSASIAFFRNDQPVLGLATNLGSLHLVALPEANMLVFASEAYFLECFLARNKRHLGDARASRQVAAGRGCLVPLDTAEPAFFDLDDAEAPASVPEIRSASLTVSDHSSRVGEIQRCTRCILPATYPFIEFDDEGVCNHCRDYRPMQLAGRDALEAQLAEHRSKDGSPDCIVAFSGGRDSSYGLHLIKTEFKMNPIAYSYDWGMVTGIARRNQARMLGKLRVEHILRAADIPAKRRYMRKNIQAWLKRPHLGMVPLFMAGDKFFYDIGRELRRELKIPLVIFCAGNELERTDFKGGFAGVRENQHGQRLFAFSALDKLKIASFYAGQYLLNPGYINASLIDSVSSFRSSFLAKDDFLYLFHHIPWDENTINDTLINQYGWETAPHTDNTWRIGDGYTTFINHIYYTIAGFSEFDTYRSQQIRKGLIGRADALTLTASDNEPDMQVLTEFMQQVGLNLEEVMSRIDMIPKLY